MYAKQGLALFRSKALVANSIYEILQKTPFGLFSQVTEN